MSDPKIEILCTLGPASFDGAVIRRLDDLGVSLFRINLSHTKAADLLGIIDGIKAHTDVPICLDTEGAQIRTGDFVTSTIELRENSLVRGHRHKVPGDAMGFNFYPQDIVQQFRVGDFISIDFNSVLVQVIDIDDDGALLRVINGGSVGRNKAVTVEREIALPPLTANDLACLKIGKEQGLRHFALSFASSQADVQEIRCQTFDDAFIISKIESLLGLANLDEIADASTAILIDRGDLSRQVPLERIPETQKAIIRTAKRIGRKAYVATNLLESMITQASPTRAEVNDIYNTMLDGADGLVLAAETAIGAHPIACTSMVVKMIKIFESAEPSDPLRRRGDPISLLVEPHGGQLVQGYATDQDKAAIPELPKITVSETTLLDCGQLAQGTYSPLRGFMDKATCESVLEMNRLPDGTIWTMPILLPVSDEQSVSFGTGERVALQGNDGEVYALIDVSDIYTLDLEGVAEKFFGTSDMAHPGVARLFRDGNRFIAGDIRHVKSAPSIQRQYALTPAQSRYIFAHKGWSRVVGFHTRNPIHRGHEHIQIEALERTGADGLYINPVVGPLKPADFRPGPIMLSYQTMLDFGLFPSGKVMLGSFSTYSRYAGPREAAFTAICRKNMGCSYFIIGRDHAGVGDFYPADANRMFLDGLGDIGIEPLFFDAVAYQPEAARHRSGASGDGAIPISGTKIRDALRNGESIPDWMMRDVVQDALRAEAGRSGSLFVE